MSRTNIPSPVRGRSAQPEGADPRMDQGSASRGGLGPVRWLDPRRRLVYALRLSTPVETPAPRDSARSQQPGGGLMVAALREGTAE